MLEGGAQPGLMLTSTSPLWPAPNPCIPAKQYLALKKGLHEASGEMAFFLKRLFQIQLPWAKSTGLSGF